MTSLLNHIWRLVDGNWECWSCHFLRCVDLSSQNSPARMLLKSTHLSVAKFEKTPAYNLWQMVPLSALLDLEFHKDRCQEVIKLVQLESCSHPSWKASSGMLSVRETRQAEKKVLQSWERDALHLLRDIFFFNWTGSEPWCCKQMLGGWHDLLPYFGILLPSSFLCKPLASHTGLQQLELKLWREMPAATPGPVTITTVYCVLRLPRRITICALRTGFLILNSTGWRCW